MAGLIAEAWIPYLIGDEDQFFNSDRFLSHGVNMSEHVENDVVNFAYKGADPSESDIVEDFNTDGTTSLAVFMRTDVPEKWALKNFSTPQLVIPSTDIELLSYDKKMSMMKGGKNALVRRIAKRGIYNIAPAGNTAKTPVFALVSGDTNGDDGYKKVTRNHFIKMRKALDNKYPGKKDDIYWAMVDVETYWTLVAEDSIIATQFGHQIKPGEVLSKLPVLNIAGFNIYADNRMPGYVDVNTKQAYGATFTSGTHLKSIQIYLEQETFATALGSTSVFETIGDPGKQADLVSFKVRAYAGPWGQTAGNLLHAAAILRIPNT